MRFIHTSDWHLGRRFHSYDLLPAQQQFLDWLLATAVAESVDAVLVAGDIYDRSQPPGEAVALLGRTVSGFADAGIPLILTAGNHDSPVRLDYGKQLFADRGIHIRADLPSSLEPVVLEDEHGPVGFYGVPYLHPDLVGEELGAARSHESVLSAVTDRITADAASRGLRRTVVSAHAFITGGDRSESELDIRVGGADNAAAGIFEGFNYVALGHLHGPQTVKLPDSDTTLAYSGSPIAFSFGERNHNKSVSLVEVAGSGDVSLERVTVPGQRLVRQVKGQLLDLIEMGRGEEGAQRDAYIKVVLTDPMRPDAPMERLRQVWPNAIALDLAPDVDLRSSEHDLQALQGVNDPLEISESFYEYVTGRALPPDREAVLQDVIEATMHAQVSA
ncbi:MAG: exonuclease SbcCD subunit D [Actinomycetia bacterium]|nr:exonuclease SbcCD subunit D [Actinomycetes bacterium]